MTLRIGVIYPSPNPLSPESWSGTPAGLAGGLRAVGAEVVPIGQFFPPVVRQLEQVLARADMRPATAMNRGAIRRGSRRWTFQRQLAAAAPLDAVVAMGTDMYNLGELRLGCPSVSYDDGTLMQMWRNADSDIRSAGFNPLHVQEWIDTQRSSLRAADAVCMSTGWGARSAREDYGVAEEKISVVGMGHRPRDGGGAERDWRAPQFLFVGIDWKRKNGDAVLDAFREVRAAHPGATLHLVGEHVPVQQPGVVDHGLLPRSDVEAQRRLDALYRQSTAFVLPSRFDPSPISYLEAASAGLPVIATTEGGAGELLGAAAITVHPDDQQALVDGMLALSSPERAQRMGVAARDAAGQASWAHVAARILSALGVANNAEEAIA